MFIFANFLPLASVNVTVIFIGVLFIGVALDNLIDSIVPIFWAFMSNVVLFARYMLFPLYAAVTCVSLLSSVYSMLDNPSLSVVMLYCLSFMLMFSVCFAKL